MAGQPAKVSVAAIGRYAACKIVFFSFEWKSLNFRAFHSCTHIRADVWRDDHGAKGGNFAPRPRAEFAAGAFTHPVLASVNLQVSRHGQIISRHEAKRAHGSNNVVYLHPLLQRADTFGVQWSPPPAAAPPAAASSIGAPPALGKWSAVMMPTAEEESELKNGSKR